ncbi:hypothetical protein IEQ34_010704 [Dendrobium chrysotoxum]|uniref:Conserved oligomeric Golgi complex subunit 8 n=1 Tax=Dendrobium chrysotoxum TaxID=161865 RepID=A0AAV7GVI5_DENCH|nr:hypothetical protein IEQ34_010704 [Dendrobium chrysotoxum]
MEVEGPVVDGDGGQKGCSWRRRWSVRPCGGLAVVSDQAVVGDKAVPNSTGSLLALSIPERRVLSRSEEISNFDCTGSMEAAKSYTGGEDEGAAVTGLLPLAGASQQPYVSELLSFTLDRLHKEPELLRVDAERIRRQMQEVAVGNYRAFISASDALSFIRDQLTGFDKHLELLTTEIPKLTSGCTEFIELAQQILEERKLNETLLANHSTVLDLLEIPQLMDTCVRNGNYDEALDLEAFVCKLAKMHSNIFSSILFLIITNISYLESSIPVIQALAVEVKQTTQSLLSQLLQRLRSNIQLPECLRIVAHLRRIGVFSESEMRLQFLRCREAWLSGILDDLDQRNVYEYLKGMVNCHRMHLFDVVNQYRAIFSNDKSGNDENYDGGLLFSWSMHQIRNHLGTLEVMLPKISEGGSLSNILDQCMYCAMGLGLVGVDFRGLLPPLFEDAVINLFSKNMSTAVENFQVVLDSHRWVPLPSVGFTSSGATEENQNDVTPPSVLMEHPPLAVFVNECWPLKEKHNTKLCVAEMRMLRWMSGFTLRDRIRNEHIREKVGVAPVEDKIRESRLRWFGHIKQRPSDDPVRKVEVLDLTYVKKGVSAAMNDLRPCAPLSRKHLLAQELVNGLQTVSNSLIHYNAVRVLRGNESSLFLSLCQAFIEVAYPYCATCFGRCYPTGAALIMERKNLLDGVSQLLTVSSNKGFKKSSANVEMINATENGNAIMEEKSAIVDGEVLNNSNVGQNGTETKPESQSSS